MELFHKSFGTEVYNLKNGYVGALIYDHGNALCTAMVRFGTTIIYRKIKCSREVGLNVLRKYDK